MITLKVINENKLLRLKSTAKFPNVVLANLQEKEVTPTKEIQEVVASQQYDGLSKVTVNPIPDDYVIPNGILEVTSNGEHNVKEYEKINVNVGGVAKGIVINEWDNNGYATDVSIIGFNEIPAYYLYEAGYIRYNNKSFMSAITTGLHFPEEITSIGQYAFYDWRNLRITELPNTLKTLKSYCFCNCENLQLKKLPASLTEINSGAFQSCTNMPLEELPETLTTIRDYAFMSCSKLAIKKLPELITFIYESTFRSCTSMQELTCEGNITTIQSYCFYGCTNLEKLVFPNVTGIPSLSNTNAFTNTKIAKGTGYIYVPDNLVDTIKSATNWSAYASQIKGISEL